MSRGSFSDDVIGQLTWPKEPMTWMNETVTEALTVRNLFFVFLVMNGMSYLTGTGHTDVGRVVGATSGAIYDRLVE